MGPHGDRRDARTAPRHCAWEQARRVFSTMLLTTGSGHRTWRALGGQGSGRGGLQGRGSAGSCLPGLRGTQWRRCSVEQRAMRASGRADLTPPLDSGMCAPHAWLQASAACPLPEGSQEPGAGPPQPPPDGQQNVLLHSHEDVRAFPADTGVRSPSPLHGDRLRVTKSRGQATNLD